MLCANSKLQSDLYCHRLLACISYDRLLYNCTTDFDHADLDHLLGVDASCQKNASALFLMKLKETRQLSQTAIDDVVEGSRAVFSHRVRRLHSGVVFMLS